jgi:hypothetical protein
MTDNNRRSVKSLFAASFLGLVVATTLFSQYRAVANYINTTQATTVNANLGDDLPGLLGNGIAPILW